MPRENFTLDIKRRLAQRAGYMCSICNILTVGPSDEASASVNLTGVAAHISAASSGPGARRYDVSLTSEQRSSIENGIWLCNKHADLIDGDEIRFTTENLKAIKKNHEEKVNLIHAGIDTNKGVITKIEASNFGPIKNSVTLNFKNNNILLGGNGVGKTLIFELIASLRVKKFLKRWINESRPKINSYYNIHYFKSQHEKFAISVDSENALSYEYNDAQIPFLIPSMSIFYLDKSYWRFVNNLKEEERQQSSVIKLMSKYFNLKEKEFVGVIGTIMRNKKFFCNDIDIDMNGQNLLASMSYRSGNHPFNALSSGEQDRVLLEITLKIASYHSKFNSTILLIENTAFSTLDSDGVNKLFEIVENEKFDFQFFFATIGDKKYNYLDFNVNRLEIEAGKTIVK